MESQAFQLPTFDASLPPSIATYLRDGPPQLTAAEIDAIYGVGAMFYTRERYAEACDLFRLMVLLRPQESRGWLSLAACHEGMGDDERALALYEVAALAPYARPDQLRARLYLARLLVKLERDEEARDRVDELDRAIGEETLEPTFAAQLEAVRAKLAQTLRSGEIGRRR